MISVAKTIKLFVGGQFPRTESGRTFSVKFHKDEKTYAHLCLASRKDIRGAVEAAKLGLKEWSGRTAYNRAQILYRMAEMLEGKRPEFHQILQDVMGLNPKKADEQISQSVDTLVYYAGFADKFSQVMASVNPVSGPFHNFTTPEPVGVVGLLYDKDFVLSDFIDEIAAILCSGNSVVTVFSGPGAVLTGVLGEVFATSDLPAGTVNLLSGDMDELYTHLGSHMEVHSLRYSGKNKERLSELVELGVENMKRIVSKREPHSLHAITSYTEFKTIWHPVGL